MDPVFGPIILCLLIAWYLTSRFGGALTSAGLRTAAAAAVGLSKGAGKVGAGRLAGKAAGWAASLRKKTPRGGARTRSGQKLRDLLTGALGGKAGEVAAGAAMGIGALVQWMRVAWVDARTAARAARERHADPDRTAPRSFRDWFMWPSGEDPEAPLPPVHAESRRLDVDQHPGTPAAISAPPTPEMFIDNTPTHPIPVLAAAPDVIDAEIVDEQPRHPIPVTPVAAITNGRNTTMDGTVVAESGLDAYIMHAEHMATQCQTAANSTEATRAAMSGQGWSGTPVEAYTDAYDSLNSAWMKYSDAAASLRAALAVREANAAHTQAGTKESVMN